MKWLPIETAPKEKSSRFIGLLQSGRAVTAIPHYRIIFDKAGEPVFSGWQEDRGDALIPRKFTHWMPMQIEITDEQVETVCRELFGEHVSECLRLHVRQALKKAFENE